MNSAVDRNQAEPREAAAARGRGPRAAEVELDLERLVWDPEYRNSVRHLFKTGSLKSGR